MAELQPPEGGRGTVATTLPLGAGMSSSAALEVAVALALGFAFARQEGRIHAGEPFVRAPWSHGPSSRKWLSRGSVMKRLI